MNGNTLKAFMASAPRNSWMMLPTSSFPRPCEAGCSTGGACLALACQLDSVDEEAKSPQNAACVEKLHGKWWYPLYKVYMGFIIRGTIPRVPPFSLWKTEVPFFLVYLLTSDHFFFHDRPISAVIILNGGSPRNLCCQLSSGFEDLPLQMEKWQVNLDVQGQIGQQSISVTEEYTAGPKQISNIPSNLE